MGAFLPACPRRRRAASRGQLRAGRARRAARTGCARPPRDGRRGRRSSRGSRPSRWPAAGLSDRAPAAWACASASSTASRDATLIASADAAEAAGRGAALGLRVGGELVDAPDAEEAAGRAEEADLARRPTRTRAETQRLVERGGRGDVGTPRVTRLTTAGTAWPHASPASTSPWFGSASVAGRRARVK